MQLKLDIWFTHHHIWNPKSLSSPYIKNIKNSSNDNNNDNNEVNNNNDNNNDNNNGKNNILKYAPAQKSLLCEILKVNEPEVTQRRP